MRQAQAVKKGVAAAGGTPREFCTITVTDGIAMGHEGMKSSLPSREVIADSVELTMRGHAYDALVGLAGCDKSLPGMMMAMCRLNVPSIFIYGGSILPGTFKGQAGHRAGRVRGGRQAFGRRRCPTPISTSSSRSPARRPAPAARSSPPTPWRPCPRRSALRCRIRPARRRLTKSATRFCMTAGEQVMDLIVEGIRPRDIVTRKALENAAAVVAASGGSTNAALHLPAIAHECGIEFDLFDVAEVFKRTPYIADLKPGGRYVAKDMFEAGGIPLLMKTLLDHGFLHGDCMTVTGRTIAENLKSVKWNPDQDVVRPANKPITETGGVVGLKGNLAPEGAIVKVAGMDELKFTGPARCFDGEEACFAAVKAQQVQGRRRVRDPLRGPEGRPRHARDAGDHGGALRPGHGRQGRADHRRPLLRRDARLLHRPCRAGGGGRRPDRARCATATSSRSTPTRARSTSRSRPPSSPSARKTWKPRETDFGSGYIWKYAQQVGARPAWRGDPSGRRRREVVLCGYLASSPALR